jgi:Zn-dependent protease with chaperone function
LNANGQAGYLNDYREYKLVDDKAVNAWCMPGGKIVVYRNFRLLKMMQV